MEDKEVLKLVQEKAQEWLKQPYDKTTRKEVKDLLENNKKSLIDAFYKNLEFGTGGLRGIMGAGTNRMNIYTVGIATQGLCNYLKKQFHSLDQIKVVVAHDNRNNSRLFAETVANIFSGNNIKVFLFKSLRPTPELSFAIRHLKCQSGVVITASHNPKEYNGYKAYWEDAGQLINPHDTNVIEEAKKIVDINNIKFKAIRKNIQLIGENIDAIYLEKLKSLSLSPEAIKHHNDLKIVYTPLHGAGVKLVPAALKKFGFTNIITVKEQEKIDGTFPTIKSPNPEEPAALEMAIEKAKEVDADLVMGTDPDADRVGIAVKNNNNQFILLNGNQTAAILIYYLLKKWSEKNKLTGKEYIIKTIVTSELLTEIAMKFDVEHFDVLTGFKYIAALIKHYEGKKTFIGGGEESYGYLAGEFVRDKDAVMSCSLIAEAAAWAKNDNKSLFDLLIDIYIEFGFYKEHLISIVKKGKSGSEEIQQIMNRFRNEPPETIHNSEIMLINDYLTRKTYDLLNNIIYDIELPKSNVLQFILKDGSKISLRPSGTEPKIKFYFSVKDVLLYKDKFEEINNLLDRKIENIIRELQLDE